MTAAVQVPRFKEFMEHATDMAWQLLQFVSKDVILVS